MSKRYVADYFMEYSVDEVRPLAGNQWEMRFSKGTITSLDDGVAQPSVQGFSLVDVQHGPDKTTLFFAAKKNESGRLVTDRKKVVLTNGKYTVETERLGVVNPYEKEPDAA